MINREQTITDVVNTTTWGGAGIAIVGAVSITQWLALGGFILAAVGLGVNIWFRRSLIKIERERLEKEFPSDRQDKV